MAISGLTTETDLAMMRLAVAEARKAAEIGEVPVGCVIASGGEVIASAHNRRETGRNALYHAELLAIDRACKELGGWRLHMCDLYVTLEPCPMCMGAAINSRIRRVIYGASDPKAGCLGGITDFGVIPFNHHPGIAAGILERECAALLQEFFQDLRRRKALCKGLES